MFSPSVAIKRDRLWASQYQMMILEIWNIKLDEGALCSVYATSVWTNNQSSDSTSARDCLKDASDRCWKTFLEKKTFPYRPTLIFWDHVTRNTTFFLFGLALIHNSLWQSTQFALWHEQKYFNFKSIEKLPTQSIRECTEWQGALGQMQYIE